MANATLSPWYLLCVWVLYVCKHICTQFHHQANTFSNLSIIYLDYLHTIHIRTQPYDANP